MKPGVLREGVAGWVSLRVLLLVGCCWVGTGRAAGVDAGRELLRDPGFVRGFALLAPKGGGVESGRMQAVGVEEVPEWQLAQWHSRFAFGGNTPIDGPFVVSNAAKWVRLEGVGGRRPALILGVDSRPEYGGKARRSAAEPWVHLLVQQSIEGAPSLAEAGSLRLRFEARLLEAETFRPEGYSAGLHAAQFQVVLTVNNVRRGSGGYGDYLWFVVPVHDDRYETPPPYVAQDFAVTQGKLIYNPGGAAFAGDVTRAEGWTRFDADLRPWLERALRAAWEKGYLRDSREPADYRVAHLNVGWEVPGLNRVAMEMRGLSLRAEP